MTPEAPVEFWKNADLVSLAAILFVVGGSLLLFRLRGGTFGVTISDTVARHRWLLICFVTVMCVFFPIYYAYLWLWLLPLTGTPVWMYGILLLAGIAELGFVLVPSRHGWRRRFHQVCASITAGAMLLLPAVVVSYGSDTPGWFAIFTVGFYVIASWMLLRLRSQRERLFTYETAYIVYFLMLVSLAGHALPA